MIPLAAVLLPPLPSIPAPPNEPLSPPSVPSLEEIQPPTPATPNGAFAETRLKTSRPHTPMDAFTRVGRTAPFVFRDYTPESAMKWVQVQVNPRDGASQGKSRGAAKGGAVKNNGASNGAASSSNVGSPNNGNYLTPPVPPPPEAVSRAKWVKPAVPTPPASPYVKMEISGTPEGSLDLQVALPACGTDVQDPDGRHGEFDEATPGVGVLWGRRTAVPHGLGAATGPPDGAVYSDHCD